MLAQWLKESNFTICMTGAGMSTESHIPDFRSASGLWKGKDPRELASTMAMRGNKEEFIAFYQKRMQTLLDSRPHAGHDILAAWQSQGLIGPIITQNTDGLHQQAGCKDVIELHGTLRKVHCLECGAMYPMARYLDLETDCPKCGGFLRPSVVLFGEMLPENALEEAEEAAKKAELFIVFGSSLVVTPANVLPRLAKERGAKLVIVNQDTTPLDGYADLLVQNMKIGEYLQMVNKELAGLSN